MNNNVTQIKLVDRTFNYDAGRANAIWKFILEHNRRSHFHFEIAADLLTDDNLELLSHIPENTFRFEIGIQSASQSTLEQVKRSADLQRIFSNVRRLAAETRVDLHLDLVAGLPGEGYDGFLASLATVASLQQHDIQIEPLKLLKGSPMREIARREGYHFSDFPPYTILGTPWLSYEDICRIETIGRLLDLFNKHGGCSAALRVLQRTTPFSVILDRMARQAGNENLSSLSRRRVFELFARLAEPLADSAGHAVLYDALFFDYCQSEMPLMGKLPSFAAGQQYKCSWPALRDLPNGLTLPPGSRVKLFRYEFMSDYRRDNGHFEPVTLTFAYVSTAGHGLQVTVSSAPR